MKSISLIKTSQYLQCNPMKTAFIEIWLSIIRCPLQKLQALNPFQCFPYSFNFQITGYISTVHKHRRRNLTQSDVCVWFRNSVISLTRYCWNEFNKCGWLISLLAGSSLHLLLIKIKASIMIQKQFYKFRNTHSGFRICIQILKGQTFSI